ncbi:unnamed protein product, partial [Brachionus calyciflorus]
SNRLLFYLIATTLFYSDDKIETDSVKLKAKRKSNDVNEDESNGKDEEVCRSSRKNYVRDDDDGNDIEN